MLLLTVANQRPQDDLQKGQRVKTVGIQSYTDSEWGGSGIGKYLGALGVEPGVGGIWGREGPL